MSETKHTPGPWTFEPGPKGEPDVDDSDFLIVATGCDEVVATVPGPIGEGATEANARLIAAAPELLSHLCYCVDLLASSPDASRRGAVESARATIKKIRP